jgi:hypothetical protein
MAGEQTCEVGSTPVPPVMRPYGDAREAQNDGKVIICVVWNNRTMAVVSVGSN